MRGFVLSLITAVSPIPATADISTFIAENGLAAAEEQLRSVTDPSPDDLMALGGVTFLRVVETVYQERWRYGFSGTQMPIPMLQAQLPQNPRPEPVGAGVIDEILSRVIADMAATDAVLARIPAEADPALLLRLPDLWLDVDADGERSPGEGFVDLVLPALLGPWQLYQLRERAKAQPDQPNPLVATIRFDKPDVSWLRAYTHLVSAIAETIRAFGPTTQLQEILDFRAAIDMQREASLAKSPMLLFAEREEFAFLVDTAVMITEMLRTPPDADGLARARDHYSRMVALNRQFWKELQQETDDEMEWIPLPTQTAALGFDVPEEVDTHWLAILEDGQKILDGELLIPHWRMAEGFGINLAAYIDAPGPLPILQLFQGNAFLPYVERGEIVSAENWQRFQMLVRGNAGLFAVLLN